MIAELVNSSLNNGISYYCDQVSSERERAVYVMGLPGTITTQKLEGLLESEADCSVDEVYLLKVIK